ncbi:MAG: NADH-quinone oxidoreductase subunit C [Anaerovoracaceae bacterium]
MSEKLFEKQNFIPVTASELLAEVRDYKANGHRLAQICATKISEGFQVLYSFDKEHELFNLRLIISEDQEIQSITGEYWSAFIYENEMHDLFGIKIKNSELDYGGQFFKVAQPTPWNPKK